MARYARPITGQSSANLSPAASRHTASGAFSFGLSLDPVPRSAFFPLCTAPLAHSGHAAGFIHVYARNVLARPKPQANARQHKGPQLVPMQPGPFPHAAVDALPGFSFAAAPSWPRNRHTNTAARPQCGKSPLFLQRQTNKSCRRRFLAPAAGLPPGGSARPNRGASYYSATMFLKRAAIEFEHLAKGPGRFFPPHPPFGRKVVRASMVIC